MKENVVAEKSFEFAVRVVRLCQWLREEKRERIMSNQLLRSGTAIGALVREAEHAESRADFIHKLSIALKEANESGYWVELLARTGYIGTTAFSSIQADLSELPRILVSIIKTTRSRATP